MDLDTSDSGRSNSMTSGEPPQEPHRVHASSWLGGAQRHHLGLVLAVVAVVVVATALLVWRTAIQTEDRFWERIQESGRWRIGMDPSFPPFEDLDDDGKPVGFDVDLAQAIAARWNVQAQIEGIGFDGLVDAVWASKVDSAISAMPLQPQFSEDVAFSRPYFEAGLVVVTAENFQAGSIDELHGKRIAVEWGSEGDLQARVLRRRFPDLQILPKETPQAALEALLAGEADVALVDNISALEFAGQGNSIRIEPDVVVSDPYVIVMPRKAPFLQERVAEALAALEADGTLEALTEKWFGVQP